VLITAGLIQRNFGQHRLTFIRVTEQGYMVTVKRCGLFR